MISLAGLVIGALGVAVGLSWYEPALLPSAALLSFALVAHALDRRRAPWAAHHRLAILEACAAQPEGATHDQIREALGGGFSRTFTAAMIYRMVQEGVLIITDRATYIPADREAAPELPREEPVAEVEVVPARELQPEPEPEVEIVPATELETDAEEEPEPDPEPPRRPRMIEI